MTGWQKFNAVMGLVGIVCSLLSILISVLIINDVPYPEWLP